MRKSEVAVAAILLISFIIAVYLYPTLPDNFASHWNAAGEVDGYMPKLYGVLLMPLLLVLVLLLFVLIPSVDPLKSNIQKFREYYDMFIVVVSLFLFYTYLLILLWNLGYMFNMLQVISPEFGILLYSSGILTEHARKNWFIGIRTPWTLSSEKVWNKTHRVGGKLLKASGIICLFGLLFPAYAVLLIVIPIVVSVVYVVVYSYVEYQKEH